MSALVIGALLAALALAFVMQPIFRHAPRRSRDAGHDARPGAPADVAVRALREIEFDRATGKLSDADYEALKAQYTSLALDEMRAQQPLAVDAVHHADLAEALIRTARSASPGCPHCGAIPPEPDAAYCSSCGVKLAA